MLDQNCCCNYCLFCLANYYDCYYLWHNACSNNAVAAAAAAVATAAAAAAAAYSRTMIDGCWYCKGTMLDCARFDYDN